MAVVATPVHHTSGANRGVLKRRGGGDIRADRDDLPVPVANMSRNALPLQPRPRPLAHAAHSPMPGSARRHWGGGRTWLLLPRPPLDHRGNRQPHQAAGVAEWLRRVGFTRRGATSGAKPIPRHRLRALPVPNPGHLRPVEPTPP